MVTNYTLSILFYPGELNERLMGLIFSLFMFYLKSKPWSLEPVKTLLGRSSNDFMDQWDSHLLYTQKTVKAVDLTLLSRCVDVDTLLLMNTVS